MNSPISPTNSKPTSTAMFPQRFNLASSSLLLLLLVASQTSSAFTFLQSAPQCAQGCGALLSTQSTCLPASDGGVHPVENMAAYKGCFCDSTRPQILAAPTTYCVDTCPDPNDAASVLDWFNGFCASDAVTTSSTPGSVPTSVAPTSTPVVVNPTSSTSTAVPTGSGSYAPYRPKDKGSWWHQHGKWIIMVIVLVIGFSIITAGGIYYKRRYDLKHNVTSPLTSNGAWGPNTTQFRSSSVYEADEAGHLSSVREKRASGRSMQEKRRMPGR